MITLMQTLKDAGTPIDGVGFQLHLFADFDRFDEVENSFQQIADLDLDVYITELDVSMRSEHSLEQQADVYEKILSLCLNQPRCKAFQSWVYRHVLMASRVQSFVTGRKLSSKACLPCVTGEAEAELAWIIHEIAKSFRIPFSCSESCSGWAPPSEIQSVFSAPCLRGPHIIATEKGSGERIRPGRAGVS